MPDFSFSSLRLGAASKPSTRGGHDSSPNSSGHLESTSDSNKRLPLLVVTAKCCSTVGLVDSKILQVPLRADKASMAER